MQHAIVLNQSLELAYTQVIFETVSDAQINISRGLQSFRGEGKQQDSADSTQVPSGSMQHSHREGQGTSVGGEISGQEDSRLGSGGKAGRFDTVAMLMSVREERERHIAEIRGMLQVTVRVPKAVDHFMCGFQFNFYRSVVVLPGQM